MEIFEDTQHTVKILSLDSSSPVASVAFVTLGDGEPVVSFQSDTPHARSDSAALFSALESAVKECGTPDALCVGLGPGSYNGLRSGIAAARGFATALGLPLYALPSPLAMPGPPSGFWAAGDARGGHYWVACIQAGAFVEEPILLSPTAAADHLRTRPSLPILSHTPLADIGGIQIATPGAVRLAILTQRADPYKLTPEPLYLKPAHITAPRQRT